MKTAYVGVVPANLSVGGVLTFKVIQHLIDVDGAEIIDFGIGDEEYKSKWMSRRRERWGIMAYNRRTAKGALLDAVMQRRTWARGTLRSSATQRSEEHTSELQSLIRNSYAGFSLKK